MTRKNLLKIMGFLSLLSLILFAVIYFVYSDIRNKNKKISMLEQELLFQNNQYGYLVSMQKLVDNLKPEITKIENSIIPSDGDVDFIENLEKLAKDRNLTIEIASLNLENDQKATTTPVSTLKIKAKTEGSWSDSYLFIAELESLPYKIKINRISLLNSGEVISKSNSKWQASFEISVLKYK